MQKCHRRGLALGPDFAHPVAANPSIEWLGEVHTRPAGLACPLPQHPVTLLVRKLLFDMNALFKRFEMRFDLAHGPACRASCFPSFEIALWRPEPDAGVLRGRPTQHTAGGITKASVPDRRDDRNQAGKWSCSHFLVAPEIQYLCPSLIGRTGLEQGDSAVDPLGQDAR